MDAGGMLMIGDMFNDRLKARVAALCIDVADAVGNMPPSEATAHSAGSDWWSAQFGVPSTVGSQNAMRYAFFPASRRLVIDDNGQISTFDTGEHVIVWREPAAKSGAVVGVRDGQRQARVGVADQDKISAVLQAAA